MVDMKTGKVQRGAARLNTRSWPSTSWRWCWARSRAATSPAARGWCTWRRRTTRRGRRRGPSPRSTRWAASSGWSWSATRRPRRRGRGLPGPGEPGLRPVSGARVLPVAARGQAGAGPVSELRTAPAAACAATAGTAAATATTAAVEWPHPDVLNASFRTSEDLNESFRSAAAAVARCPRETARHRQPRRARRTRRCPRPAPPHPRTSHRHRRAGRTLPGRRRGRERQDRNHGRARRLACRQRGSSAPISVLGLHLHPQGRTASSANACATRLRRLAHQFRHPRPARPEWRPAVHVVAAEPTVLTYHAYAGRLLSEHGLRPPVQPGVRLLSERRRGRSRTASCPLGTTSWTPTASRRLSPRTSCSWPASWVSTSFRPRSSPSTRPGCAASSRTRRAPRGGGPRCRRSSPEIMAAQPSGSRCCRSSRSTTGASATKARWTSPTRCHWPPSWPAGTRRSWRRAGALRRRAARRIPGHRARPARAAAGAVRRRREPADAGHRGRRPRAGDLRLARGERGQPAPVHHGLPAA